MPSKQEIESPEVLAEARIQEAFRQQSDELDLSKLELTQVPHSIAKLTNLLTLNISDNQLTSLPEQLGGLTKLLGLLAWNNRLTTLPVSFSKLTSLRVLALSRNRLTKIPEWFGQLANLEVLFLDINRLSNLHASLGELKGLRTLHLDGNRLLRLERWIGGLTNLTLLNLANTGLTSLPVEIRNLRALTQLFLNENPALGIPVELLGPPFHQVESGVMEAANPSAILDYYFLIHEPEGEGIAQNRRVARVLRELKIILVGRGEVGKSSLVDVLQGEKFVEGKKKTEGIAITRWLMPLPDGEATALVWDFGGQEIMHGTHQFFLTHRSLYLVVLDGRHDRAKQDAEYWLKLIHAFGAGSPVLVVLNKQGLHAFDTDREYLATKYGIPREHFFRTDCTDAESIDKLRQAIQTAAARMLQPPELFPPEWWDVKQRLGKMREHGEDYLSDESYVNVCKELGVDSENAEKMLPRLADLGIVVSFPEDLRLRELTVLNPEWVTDGIYRVLNDATLQEKRHGQLVWSDLSRILPPDRWPKRRHRYLVELMRKFQLCFPLEDEDETELVPELLPDKTPQLDDWRAAECLVFLYQYTVLPQGLLPRFITRTHVKSRGRDRWRSGVLIGHNGAEAVVRADYDTHRVIVWVRGQYADERRALLTVVRDHFAAIHSRIEGLNPQELVTVNGYPDVAVSFDDLILDERAGEQTTRVTINGRRVDVRITELLNGVESPEDRAKRAKEEERLGSVRAIVHDHRIMGDNIAQTISGGTFHGPVAAVMNDTTNIINNQPAGKQKELLEELKKRVSEMIAEAPSQNEQLKKMVADRLKELTEGVTSGTPDRAWYSVSAKGLLEAAKFVKEFTGEISGTLKNIGKNIWPDFSLPE